MAKERFNHQAIEKSAQETWAAAKLYETNLETAKDPYYLLFEFPYPSGDLHIGHWYAFALTDIYARYLRMTGKDVLFPIGFDAFGLPAENAAMKYGKDPKAWTFQNMDTMRTQLRSMGTSVDWSKEVVTCDPEYYRWTQWLFAQLFEAGLAERKEAPVKWCPKDQTVLANEQVMDGKCERCGTEVEEKKLTQWFMKITKYAEQLLSDLEPLPWREEIKEAQRQWIGKSEGARLSFALVEAGGEELNVRADVFTTRADTVFGATYLVLAPEHPLIETLLASALNAEEVRAYREATKRKTERERSENKEKTGVALGGVMAMNPATKEPIPVYVADYVLASYGTGAVMAVPAHDERDFEFASKFNLPIKHVIAPEFIDGANPPIDGKPMVVRNAILAIVRNPATGKYLALKWKEQPWTTFITGGVDDGEDLIEAALREIHEETGYKNLKFMRILGGPMQAKFFAAHKDVNRTALNSVILFDLVDEEQDAVSEEELRRHEPCWLDLEEIAAEKLRHAEIQVILSRMRAPDAPYVGDGVLVHSGAFNGRNNREALAEIVEYAGGETTTNYRIRDWLISRQRYWGCPIPMVYDPQGNPHYVGDENLPWLLPEDVDFSPHGEAPLASSKELKERVTRLFGEGWTPEYDTLDTFVDSSWYFYRYLSPKNETSFTDATLLKKWMPVNRYSGGSEHTTMHLLYARFFHKALAGLGLVEGAEPFHERFNRGLILGPDGAKMSKSKGNVVNPDEFVSKYGSDAVRMYLAFIGPYNEPGSYPWSLEGVDAMRKFLDRIYRLQEKVVSDAPVSEDTSRALAKAADKIGDDITRFKLNTAVSALMVLLNELESLKEVPAPAYRDLLRLLAPSAPHLAEHLWEAMGETESIHTAAWPVFDKSLLSSGAVTLVVQVAGKKRGEVTLPMNTSEDQAVEAALRIGAVVTALGGREVGRKIYVPGKILNLVPK